MGSISWLFEPSKTPRTGDTSVMKDYHDRLELAALEAAERRRREMAEQSSGLNSPQERIRVWEKLHGLKLPSDENHPVLDSIAVATQLTLEQIREEQRRRGPASRRVSSPYDRA